MNTFEVHHKDGQPMDNRPENHVALCRPCHNLREGKKPSIEEIQNLRDSLDEDQEGEEDEVLPNGVNRIYTAGSMHYHNDEDSTWRASVQGLGSTSAEIVSPKDVTYDHGGDLVAGVAGKDLELLDTCDAVVAYFDKEEQVGTLTELMYAVSEGKPALVLFHQNLIHGPAAETIHDFPIAQAEIEEGIGIRFESPVYWFLINTLIGDSNGWVDGESWDGVDAPVEARIVCNEEAIRPAFNKWQKEWVRDPEPKRLQGHSHRDAARESLDTEPRRVNDVADCPNCGAPLYERTEKHLAPDGTVAACESCVGREDSTKPSDQEIKQMLETVDRMNSENDQIPVSELMDE